ncbi:MAG: hypothetical protein ACKVKV_08685 [Dehalococcoidia bacterium]
MKSKEEVSDSYGGRVAAEPKSEMTNTIRDFDLSIHGPAIKPNINPAVVVAPPIIAIWYGRSSNMRMATSGTTVIIRPSLWRAIRSKACHIIA